MAQHLQQHNQQHQQHNHHQQIHITQQQQQNDEELEKRFEEWLKNENVEEYERMCQMQNGNGGAVTSNHHSNNPSQQLSVNGQSNNVPFDLNLTFPMVQELDCRSEADKQE
uniref:Uncharacterized protein n=1 Tax=Romanomermis culicivorax TaxID=13658 RepID=A0A915LDJ7_ROMCU